MNPEDLDSDDYFEALAGRPLPGGTRPDSGIQAMRSALQAQAQTLSEAQHAQAADLSAEEAQRMAALKQRLIESGVFRKQKLANAVTPRASAPISNALRRLHESLFGSGWQRPMAMAFSVMLLSAVVLRLALEPTDESGIERGGASPVLVAEQPAKAAEDLATALRAAGAEVLLVQVNSEEWSMRVTAGPSAALPTITKVLEDAGVGVSGEPPYRVIVRSKRKSLP